MSFSSSTSASGQDTGAFERWMVPLVLCVLIAPIWLVTRDLFDGATVTLARELQNPDGLYFWLMNSNWLLAVWFFKAAFALDDWTGIRYLWWAKLAFSGMVVGLYFEMRRVGQELLGMDRATATLAGLLCVCSPSLYIFVNSGAIPILLCIWLLFVGHRLFRVEGVTSRIVGLAVLAASFQLNSNLVFALALQVLVLWQRRTNLRRELPWFLALFATAVAVYATMRVLAPPRQLFVEYNQLLQPWRGEDLRRIVRAVAMFLTWGIIPLACALALGLCLFVFRARPPAGANPTSVWAPVLACAFLCAAAAFPYVMVGKGPPLFTYLGLGNSLTEQVLRAAYDGPFAPTWANTSARHGLLFSLALALLTWQLMLVVQRLAARRGRVLTPRTMFLAMLPCFLVWVLPAYKNKLETQLVEISFVKAFRELPPPPAGVVEVHYTPITDWLIWSNSGAIILRHAWGTSHHWAMFHSVDAYLKDLQWQYHVYFKGPGGLGSPRIQRSAGVQGFPGEECIARYDATLPARPARQWLLAGWRPDVAEPARVVPRSATCQPGYVMPNPTPEKKAIL